MATTRSFCLSVLLPLATLLALLLLTGCRPTPVAPLPTPDQHQVQPVQPDKKQPICCRPTIWAFGAEWCGSCRAGQQKLDDMEKMGVAVMRVNIDQRPDLAAQYAITSIPVYYVIRCGHETVRTQNIDEAVRLMNEVFGR